MQTMNQPPKQPIVTTTGIYNSEGKEMVRTETEVKPGVWYREYDWK